MAVADMRKCLSEIRAMMQFQTPENPMDLEHKLTNEMMAWEFVHRVAIGLHKKRTKNRRKNKDRVGGFDDSDFD
jgi:hypothetical protein